MEYHFLLLLIAFQAKHLIADYYLQFPYMYENKGKATGWVEPLFDHATIHALFTIIIVLFYLLYINIYINKLTLYIIILIPITAFIFDFTTHFITDRIKATRKSTMDTSQFWYNLGLDQAVHHTVGILIVYYITLL